MDYNIAKEKHREQWLKGKYRDNPELYVFPYNCNFKDDEFVEITVTKDDVILQEVDPERVNKYIKLLGDGIDLGPSWLIYGKRLKDGTISEIHDRYFVVDGNHRMTAKMKIGHTKFEAILPKSCHQQYERKVNVKNYSS